MKILETEKKDIHFQFPEVRIVEASAGSGKTYALAKRYIQLLLNPHFKLDKVPLRNILAITFTNKAALEMKVRILDFLKSMALGTMTDIEEAEILKPIGIDKKTASLKAYKIMEDVIRHYNFFQVQTIDKFINALLSGCAFKIGLTANFRIKTNSRDYLEYSLDQLIDKAHEEKDTLKLFENFLHNYLYLENRSGWFPKQDMHAIMCALFSQYSAYGLPLKKGPASAEDLIKRKKDILKDMRSLKNQLSGDTHQGFCKSFDKFLENNTAGFDVDSLSDYFARDELPVKKGSKTPPKTSRLWKKIRSQIQQVCEVEAFNLFNPYVEVFNELLEHFYRLAAKDDVLFLEELNKKASLLFDEDYVTVEELYYRLATRFHHYLIDEFQDTSRLQWRNLEKMTEEALSTGGSLFTVGDRKQAIYGFRGGDVRLFDDIKNEFHAFNVQIEYLQKNWRSRKNIVEFNNAVFDKNNLRRFIAEKQEKNDLVSLNEDDLVDIENVFEGAQQTERSGHKDGCVRMEYIDIDKKEERNEIISEKVIRLTKDLLKKHRPSDIAVLTRTNIQVQEVTNWFLQEGIQVESDRTSDIKENHLINELICLLQFLNSPINNMAFTNFIFGDIFTKAAGVSSQEMHRFVFGLREHLAQVKDFYIYTEFRKKYEGPWQKYLDEFFKNVGLYPLYELVISIYHKFDVLNNFPQCQGHLMHFLELIKRNEEDHADIASFLDHFEKLQGEDLFVHIKNSEAVSVLTIHKAKGLEFPIVILPFLGMDIQVGMPGPDYQQSYILQKSEFFIELLRLKQKYYKFSENLKSYYKREYKKSTISELNNIYVALTRAQKGVFGFIPKRIGSRSNPVRHLIPEEHYVKGPEPSTEEKEKRKEDIFKIPPSEYHDWIVYLKEEFTSADELNQRDRRLEGQIVHHMLSLVENFHSADVEDIVRGAVEQIKMNYSFVEDYEYYGRLLKKVLKSRVLKPFFTVHDGLVYTEKEIVNKKGLTKRLDRLIIKKNEVIVVDYKSSQEFEEEYSAQVKEYVSILKSLYPKHKIKGYLVYLDEIKVKEIEG